MPASSRQSDIEYNTLQTKSARSHQICRPLADFLQNLTNFKIRFNFQLAILIPTKFCTVINTTKFSLSSQNLSHESKMANSLHLKKRINLDISQQRFHWFLQNFACWHILARRILNTVQKIKFLKIQDGRRPLFWKLLNAISQQPWPFW